MLGDKPFCEYSWARRQPRAAIKVALDLAANHRIVCIGGQAPRLKNYLISALVSLEYPISTIASLKYPIPTIVSLESRSTIVFYNMIRRMPKAWGLVIGLSRVRLRLFTYSFETISWAR